VYRLSFPEKASLSKRAEIAPRKAGGDSPSGQEESTEGASIPAGAASTMGVLRSSWASTDETPKEGNNRSKKAIDLPFVHGKDVPTRALSTKTYPLVHHLAVTVRVRMTRTVRDVKGSGCFDNGFLREI